MLARATKRKLKHKSATSRHIAAAFNQLYLPWLCPAQIRWIGSTSLTSQLPSLDATRHILPRPGGNRDVSRSLATATDFYNTTHDHVPFLPTRIPQDALDITRPDSLSLLKLWTPQSQIVIHDAVATAAPFLSRQQGIGGDSTELCQNLDACLTIGRLDRAEAILRRLATLLSPEAPELLSAHNLFLRGLLDLLVLGRKDVSLKRIQRWFEVDMKGQNITADATTYALMCRAAILALPEDQRDRTIRRYLHLAEEDGLLDDIMCSEEFTDPEWEELCQARSITPEVVETPAAPEPEALTLNSNESKIFNDLVRAVEQKGLGLKSLRDSLTNVDNFNAVPYPHDAEGTEEEKNRAWCMLREIQLEENHVDSAIARWQEENASMAKMGINPKLHSKAMETIMWGWQNALEKAIKLELKEVEHILENPRDNFGDVRLEYGPFLGLVTPEKMAAITILTTLESGVSIGMIKAGKTDVGNGGKVGIRAGTRFGLLAARIGAYLETEHAALRDKRSRVNERRKHAMSRRSRVLVRSSPAASGQKFSDTVSGPTASEIGCSTWPYHVKIHMGALLISKIVDVAKISVRTSKDAIGDHDVVTEPAFTHALFYENGKSFGKIDAHEELVKMLTKSPPRHNIGLSGQLPMLVEPLPWTGFRSGGYIRYPSQFMRVKETDHIQRMYAEAAIEKGDMEQVFAGLDVLGKTAWQINKKVLKVILEVWNSGEAVASIPAENPEFTYPPEPDVSAGIGPRLQWRRLIQKLDEEKSGLHSQRCFQNLQLEVARSYADQTFYYPHNMDFRGRAYPIPPLLNHLGADNARGLLVFAKGKPLGPTGLLWLKVHVANVFGYDKASLSEREKFTMDHLDEVYDSTTNPLSGNKWWLKSENPWQCLAGCYELRDALDSPDPTQFVSHLPIHQDGTCNGLQHYAALGGDSIGAAQVNLLPSDRPADIYTGVADLVKAEISKEAAEGDPMAKVLKSKITRKVVKQTVMTNVYGVTFIGARAQVHKQLDDIMDSGSEVNISNYVLAAYVAKKIFTALKAMFSGAQSIQFWLGECAHRITTAMTPEQVCQLKALREGKRLLTNSKYQLAIIKRTERKLAERISKSATGDFRSSVVWTTPLKLPVAQPYREPRTRIIQTALQGIHLRDPQPNDPISKRKQCQAFPPNFIHSLDATHMLLSALKCDEIGLTFASVHDSFWTHAADVPGMNQALRDAFVRMHSENIIGRLAAEFRARYKDCVRLATVPARSAVGKQILQYRKQRMNARRSMKASEHDKGQRICSTMADELLEEWERQQLLKSDDPAKKKLGEAMETPASIFAAAGDVVEAEAPLEDIADIGDTESQKERGEEPTMVEVVRELNEENKNISPVSMKQRLERKRAERTKRGHRGAVTVWVPLRFPDVPAKGDFDLSRLKESTYFFS